MFFRMIRGLLTRQWKKMIMIAFTLALGTSLCTAMLSVVLDVKDKVNQELKTYGANITVEPTQSSVVSDLYEIEDGSATATTAYLAEDELGNIKTIFWAYNIVDYAPFISTDVTLESGGEYAAVGSWFNHHMSLATGEELDAGISSLRSWWDLVDGEWIDEQETDSLYVVMVGTNVAEAEGIAVGDVITLTGSASSAEFTVVGIYDSGDEEDDEIFGFLDQIQELGGLDGKIDSIEVSALTTPDNELAEKAAKDPSSLTVAQYETWYCTAYVSSICYQIQEVITDSVASAVRQVADSEGTILDKTQLLMILITILSLIGSALGICNLVTASVMERSQEIGLMKALGAYNRSISFLVIVEVMITAIIGAVVGFFAGIGFAQIIGQTVFSSSISIRPMLVPLVAVLMFVVTLVGCLPAIHTLLKLEPTEVLHGK